MESPEVKDTGSGVNGLALASFVLGISSLSGLFGASYFGAFGQDGWLFAISLIPAAAALLCAQLVRQQSQTGGLPVRGESFALTGAILAVVGALTNALTYLRIQDIDSLFG